MLSTGAPVTRRAKTLPKAKVKRRSTARPKAVLRIARKTPEPVLFVPDFPPIFEAEPKPECEEDKGYDSAPLTLGDVRKRLAEALLLDTLGPHLRKTIERREPVIVIMEVPTSAWASAMILAAKILPKAQLIEASRAPSKNAKPELPHSLPALALTSNASWLPPALLSAADHRLVARPHPAMVAGVIRQVCGHRARLHARDIAGLDLPELGFAIRSKTSARSCVERLRRAAQCKSEAVDAQSAPRLHELVGYGPAMDRIKTIAADFTSARDRGQHRFSPESILLYGPPGNGKTLLARSIAATTGVPFIAASASEWFGKTEGYLNDVIGAAMRFFEAANNAAPAVAFLDELDAIPSRASLDERHRSWWSTFVTAMLLQIDALRERRAGVLLIAATNFRGRLDEALIRPGRFDIHLEIRAPESENEIAGVLRHHLAGELAATSLSPIVALCRGSSAAAIAQIARQGKAAAAREGRPLALHDLALAAVPADNRSDGELQTVALHEAAHAIVAAALGIEVGHVSIVWEGDSGGRTQIGSRNPIPLRSDLEDQVVVFLAGRAADELIGRGPNAGARADLVKATELINAIHGEFGLGDSLVSSATASDLTHSLIRSPGLSGVLERELRRLMDRARELVMTHRGAIQNLALQLRRDRVASAADVGKHLSLTGDDLGIWRAPSREPQP